MNVLPDTLTTALAAAGIRRPEAAAGRLARFAANSPKPDSILECCIALASALVDTPVPETSLANFMRLLEDTAQPEVWSAYLLKHPRALEILVKLFVGSQHLTDTLVRQPDLLRELTQQKRLADVKTRAEFFDEARQAMSGETEPAEQIQALRRYQRREVLRIGAADTFSLFDLRAATDQLSQLAGAIIDVCLQVSALALGVDPQTLSVLALGKLGGGELNYSSDIDLVLLARDPNPAILPLAQQFLKALGDNTTEGFLYRVDMRLRPWGSSGPLVSTPDAYLGYLDRHASLWERQALLKARVVAGDEAAGRAFLRSAHSLIFRHDDVAVLRAGIRQSKERIEAEGRRQGRDWGDVKSGRGSLRDIEFIVQFLQMQHGAALPAVRTSNTLDGLVRLADFDCLASSEYRQLTDGYIFLRTIEHALQLMHNQQRHTLPSDPHELNYLARRLDYPDSQTLVARYEQHGAAIRKIYRSYLEQGEEAARPASPLAPRPVDVEVPRYDAWFSAAEQSRHRRLLAETSPQHPVRIAAAPGGGNWQVTVVGDDRPGDLSMTCGLFFVYGFDILDGFVSTALHGPSAAAGPRSVFVNTFTVRPPYPELVPEVWISYETDLNELFRLARTGEAGVAQGKLAKRVASALVDLGGTARKPSPMHIAFDNDASESNTVLRLRADDSLGFLYELTNALALCDIDIKTMAIRTHGAQIEDTLLVTDARRGGKITAEDRLRELNAAIVLIKQFTHLLPNAPNPEAALLHFRSLIAELFRQPNWVDELATLDRPDLLEALSRILGVSDFLWEDMLRLQYANLFPVLKDLSGLEAAKSRGELERNLAAELGAAAERDERRRRLNAFKDREMFRVDMRHILGKIAEFREFAEELADIAEVVINAACTLCWDELTARHGVPRTPAGEACRYVVAALGKCGGRELGFASDIELLFLYEADGMTDGAEPISSGDFFVQFVELFTAGIQARQEGIFQIDLRLRPYGRQGNLASSWRSFAQYFSSNGPAWPFERQSLVKLRPVAGNESLGRELVALRDRLIYTGQPVDHLAIHALRERQVRQLVQAGSFHAKLSPGGLVEIEYLVQLLQLRHGHAAPALRTPSTAAAATALRDAGHLAVGDHARLEAAYWFFRRLIDALRMVRGNALDLTVPARSSEEFDFLARRLGYGGDSSRLHTEIDLHQQTVLALLRQYQS